VRQVDGGASRRRHVRVCGLGNSFNLFVQDLVMTDGGPGTSTTTITMTIYQEAFNSFNADTDMAFLLAVVLAAIALVQYRFASRRS
jgi:multiple sugar transport system permease protein